MGGCTRRTALAAFGSGLATLGGCSLFHETWRRGPAEWESVESAGTDGWYAVRGGRERRGRTDSSPGLSEVAWWVELPGDEVIEPITTSDRLLFGHPRGIRCYDKSTGDRLWTFEDEGGKLATDGRYVYVRRYESSGSGLARIRADDGTLDWEVSPDADIAADMTVDERFVYTATWEGVAAFRKTDGELAWHFRPDGYWGGFPFPGFAVGTDRVFVALNDDSDETEPIVSDHRVFAVDPATESVDWHVDVARRPGQLSAGAEMVYISGQSSLLGVGTESGETLVEHENFVPDTIATHGETAYFTTRDGTVAIEPGMDAAESVMECRGHPTVGGDRLYVVCAGDDVIVLDKESLAIQQRIALPDDVYGRRGPLSVDADGGYLTTRGGYLVALV